LSYSLSYTDADTHSQYIYPKWWMK